MHGFEDLVGRLGPSKWPGVVVVELEVAVDLQDQVANASEGPAPDLLLGQGREPAFHLIEPGGTGRGEVQVIAGMLGEPPPYTGMLVSAVVVQDQMDIDAGRHLAVDQAEKPQELLVAMLGVALSDHLPAGDVERRKETGDPVT